MDISTPEIGPSDRDFHPPGYCRFDGTPAVLHVRLPGGCLVFPQDREQ